MFKTFSTMLLWFFGIYLAALALTLSYDYALFARGNFDSFRDRYTGIYAKPNVIGVYALNRLTHKPDQLLIIGSSATGRGYDADIMQAHLPSSSHVDKLALNGSNISMYHYMVRDLAALGFFDDAAERGLTVMISGNPLVFMNHEQQFGGSHMDLEVEKLRHRLYYEDKDGHVVARFQNPSLMNALRYYAVKPFVWVYALREHAREGLSEAAQNLRERLKKPKRSKAEHMRETTLKVIGTEGITGNEFAALRALVEDLRSMGAHVVYVDVPLHSILRHDYPPYEQYERQIKLVISDLGLAYYSLQDFAPDEQFEDHIHPKPEFRALWSEKLADIVKGEMKKH